MANLTSQKCVACQADAPKVTDDELVEFIKEIRKQFNLVIEWLTSPKQKIITLLSYWSGEK